jgi:hypothetical protein
MVWHWHNRNQDGLMHHAPNSTQWRFIYSQWLTFTQEAHKCLTWVGHIWGEPIWKKTIHTVNVANVIYEL